MLVLPVLLDVYGYSTWLQYVLTVVVTLLFTSCERARVQQKAAEQLRVEVESVVMCLELMF